MPLNSWGDLAAGEATVGHRIAVAGRRCHGQAGNAGQRLLRGAHAARIQRVAIDHGDRRRRLQEAQRQAGAGARRLLEVGLVAFDFNRI